MRRGCWNYWETKLISLDSPEWANLQHAYGSASDIPVLLRQLQTFPTAEGQTEPWFSLWSALAHQGDVYSASFAAVPHVVRVLAMSPTSASFSFFQFPAWIEICRQRNNLAVPNQLSPAYYSALAMLGPLVCAVSSSTWDDDFLISALSALAVSKGAVRVLEVLQLLDEDATEEFLESHR